MAEASDATIRVHLGADAWALLAAALPGAPLPHPFRAQDGPALDSAARAATERALRDGGVLAGDGGDLLADLHASLREGVLALGRPAVVVDSSTGLGDALRVAHHAIRGDAAVGLACSQRPFGDDELELGPVELSALRAGAVVAEVLRGFGSLEGEPAREPVALGASAAAEVACALDSGRPDLARAAIERHGAAPPLDALGAGLRSVARVDVASASGRRSLLAVRVAGGWWTVARGDDGVTLRPAGRAQLVAELALALAGAR